jgi:uncharacterized membrane protein (DUF106 family)
MDQTQIIFSVVLTVILAIILTYLITKNKYQKQASEFKSLQDGINESKVELDKLNLSREDQTDELKSLQDEVVTVRLSKENIELSHLKLKEKLADLIALRDKETELKISVA